MDALYNEYLITFQFQLLATPLALAFLEVVAGQFHLLATEQSVHLLVEQGYVQRMQVLEVVVAVLVQRCLLTIQEVVVQ